MLKFQKKLILFLILFFMMSSLNGVELDWEHDYQKALKEAKKETKIVYLFIGADECKYCTKFANSTLADKSVITRMQKDFVLLYMSRDQHDIPDRFEIYGVPRHYFLSPKGDILHSGQGIWDKDGWFSILDDVIAEN